MKNEKGEILTEAHGGGGGDIITIFSHEEIPEFSVLRKKKTEK